MYKPIKLLFYSSCGLMIYELLGLIVEGGLCDYKDIIATFIAIFAISSCSDDRDPFLDQTSAKVAQFKSAPSGTYTVTENNMQNVFETFVITPPVYNINTEYVYQLHNSHELF